MAMRYIEMMLRAGPNPAPEFADKVASVREKTGDLPMPRLADLLSDPVSFPPHRRGVVRYVERTLRKSGHRELAGGIDLIYRSGGEFALPLPQVGAEGIDYRPELMAGVRLFTAEQKRRLNEAGYTVYVLVGQSVHDLKELGKRFDGIPQLESHYLAMLTGRVSGSPPGWYSRFIDIPSRRSEVAININRPFLPDSSNNSFRQQEEMIANFSQEVSAQIHGVRAIIGEAPDYAELAFLHLDLTGQRLFEDEECVTKTRVRNFSNDTYDSAAVIKQEPDGRLSTRITRITSKFVRGNVAPLIIPV